MHKLKILFTFLLLSTFSFSQPTNNPFLTMYPSTPASHWTQVLKWNQIFSVTDYGANGNDQLTDQASVEQAIEAAYLAGGGVVYFPAGRYIFTDDLALKSGVILRGENPLVSKAIDSNFRPASRLEFPAYVFDTLANGGRGTSNQTAFKIIGGIGSFKNVGVVNLDVNRARIQFHPNFDSLGVVVHAGAPSGSVNYQMREQNRNCIIMGVRSNNAAMADPNLPDTSGPGKMRKWQRAPYRFAANLDLFFAENVVIANNRINDNPTDNFNQPGYKVRNRCTTCSNYKSVGQPNNSTWNAENFVPVLNGLHARFRYEDHYGITLNRHKLVMINGKQTIQAFIWYPEPEQEPSLYAKGFSILDNWIYKTSRVGIWAAGQGMEIRRNIIRDSAIAGSSATPKSVWLNPGFTEINRNFSATYENRGIDFGGSEINIDSNDVQMRTFRFPESIYGSIDGEGILDQGNGGGTKPNGIYITNNIIDGDRNDCTNPTIGLYNTQEANNVVYKGNKFTGNSGCIQVQMRDATMTNVLMENNTGIKTMEFYGRGGGYNCIARNNVGAPGQFGRVSCYVVLENNTGLSFPPAGCTQNTAAAIDTNEFPAIRLVNPKRDTLFTSAPATYQLEAQIMRGVADSVVFFRDSFIRLGKGISLGNGLWSLAWNPPTLDGKYYITASSYFTPVVGNKVRLKAQPILFEINDGNPFINNPDDQIVGNQNHTVRNQAIHIFPNPSSDHFYIQTGSEEKLYSIEILDLGGRILKKTSCENQSKICCETLRAGLYYVRVNTSFGSYNRKVIIQK